MCAQLSANAFQQTVKKPKNKVEVPVILDRRLGRDQRTH
jgi:hypothetical protein